ncbi:MAG: hypothetical protein DHS20C18_01150 [Saprospiraceae bacterium]|nr:MAG: hypothetical protein DHS20C18_01150 [Saprospiraceae bacterium]
MKKQITALVFLAIAFCTPLGWSPELIISNKILFLIFYFWLILTTQPAIDLAEARIKKDTDQFSVFIVLGFSVFSVSFAVYEWAYLLEKEPPLAWEVIGGLLLAAGLGLRIWSIRILGKYFTTTVKQVDNHQLVTSGPYASIRHPSYLGAYLAFLGNAVFLGAWMAAGFTFILMLVAYNIRINVEEKTLVQIFGDQYQQYQKRTKRLLPYIW